MLIKLQMYMYMYMYMRERPSPTVHLFATVELFPALDPSDLTESGLDIYPSAGFGTGKFQWKEEAMAWRHFCTNGIRVPLHITSNFQSLTKLSTCICYAALFQS